MTQIHPAHPVFAASVSWLPAAVGAAMVAAIVAAGAAVLILTSVGAS